MKTIKVKASSSISVHIVAKAESRDSLSLQHIRSAALFARMSLNKEFTGVRNAQLLMEHQAFVIASVFASVAFVEATINETWAIAGELAGLLSSPLASLGDETLARIDQAWSDPQTERKPILDKYQLALNLADREEFTTGNDPYQSIDSLIYLRNELTHYKLQPFMSLITDSKKRKDAENKSNKYWAKFKDFAPNPLASSPEPFFPSQVLTYKCAKWGVDSSINFVDDFCTRIGLEPPYDFIRSELKTT